MTKAFDLPLTVHMVKANISNFSGLKASDTAVDQTKVVITALTSKKIPLGTLTIEMNDQCVISDLTGVFLMDEFKSVMDKIKETLKIVNS